MWLYVAPSSIGENRGECELGTNDDGMSSSENENWDTVDSLIKDSAGFSCGRNMNIISNIGGIPPVVGIIHTWAC